MKKYFVGFIVATFMITGCKKEVDHVFDQSPDERLNEALAKYQAQLTGSPNGWNAVLYPKGGGAYAFYFKFNDANRVQMVSDFDSASAVTVKESSYRLKALQQPSLLFDTYSYIHVLSDPSSDINGGTDGAGLVSDFEFYFSDSTSSADSIILIGRVNGSKAILTKATQEQADAYTNGAFNIDLFREKFSNILQYFKRFAVGGSTYDMNIKPSTKTIIFTWTDADGNTQTFTTAYYYTLDGIAFQYPFISGSTIITGFSNLSWSASTSTINLSAGGATATIKGAAKPLVPDLNGPRRWWQSAVDADAYWATFYGFESYTQQDIYGVTAIPDYAFMIFWPRYGTSGGINYDLTGFVINGSNGISLNFGAATRPPNFTNDGRIIFTNLGTLGDVPAEAEDAYNGTAAKLGQSSGFYLVQTAEDSYDMVSASDAKSWITWYQGW